jgi:CheY-like chemotaxis protein
MKNKLNCVLLIDDDEPTNFLNEMVVRNAGCSQHIEIASSGKRALLYLTQSCGFTDGQAEYPCPDLIFLDVNMPAMNGWEFLGKYNDLEKGHRKNIRIIMLTTSINPDDQLKAKEIPDVAGFESKPLTTGKLKRILEKYFAVDFLKSV